MLDYWYILLIITDEGIPYISCQYHICIKLDNAMMMMDKVKMEKKHRFLVIASSSPYCTIPIAVRPHLVIIIALSYYRHSIVASSLRLPKPRWCNRVRVHYSVLSDSMLIIRVKYGKQWTYSILKAFEQGANFALLDLLWQCEHFFFVVLSENLPCRQL